MAVTAVFVLNNGYTTDEYEVKFARDSWHLIPYDTTLTNTLSLSGLSISDTSKVSILDINQKLDMTGGRINAMYTTVSFSGSITPRLVVRDKIQDSTNSDYYWDVKSKVANFYDVSFPELSRMASLVVREEGGASTVSGSVFSSVAANQNATVADYINAINEIQTKVRAKYTLLKLE